MRWTGGLTLPARLDAVDAVARFVLDLCRECRLAGDVTTRLRLAADEIATNIVVHGYAQAVVPPPDGTFRVEGGCDDSCVRLRFLDRAAPFDPTRRPDPEDLDAPLSERRVGGLGIYLVRRSVDEFTYQREQGCNVLTLAVKRA